ncbi:hypothetical protein RKD31_007155 [Streptomyces sp. SAI-163]
MAKNAPGRGEDPDREQALPGAQGEVQAEAREDGQVDAQEFGGGRPGGDGCRQQGDAPGARGAEEGGGVVGGDLADIHDLVPAEAHRGVDEDQLGQDEDGGDHRDRRVAAQPPGGAGRARRLASASASADQDCVRAVGHRAPLTPARRGVSRSLTSCRPWLEPGTAGARNPGKHGQTNPRATDMQGGTRPVARTQPSLGTARSVTPGRRCGGCSGVGRHFGAEMPSVTGPSPFTCASVPW